MLTQFPIWLNATHFLNALLLVLLVRSGVQVLSSYPFLHLREESDPNHLTIKFGKLRPPAPGQPMTSLKQELFPSPWLALPGGHQLGLGRHWHLVSALLWVVTGSAYVVLLFLSGQWRRLVPTSPEIFPRALQDLTTYLQFRLAEPPPGLPYNGLQQLTYFAVVFLLAPLLIITGAGMSPALSSRFPRLVSLLGGTQKARTMHFAGLLAFIGFTIGHLALVLIHGAAKELGTVTLGRQGADPGLAIAITLAGLAVIAAVAVLSTVLSRRHPRATQRGIGLVLDPLQSWLTHRVTSYEQLPSDQITRHFWVNGNPPQDPEYERLGKDGFRDWRLEVGGLVDRPRSLSLTDLRGRPMVSQVTRHRCIQGWSGIARWTGVPISDLLDLVGAHESARYVVFHAFDDKDRTEPDPGGGFYYEALTIEEARQSHVLLALEMGDEPLTVDHGAPARLRIGNQLGFKMVKWVTRIEVRAEIASLGQGQGGWREDRMYYGFHAGI